jgi:hypothetical protein
VYLAVTQHTAAPLVHLNLRLREGTSQRRVSGAKVPRDSPIPVHTRGSRYTHTNALCVRPLRRLTCARRNLHSRTCSRARAHAWIHLHRTDAGRRGTLETVLQIAVKIIYPSCPKESLLFAVKQRVLRNGFPSQDDARCVMHLCYSDA